jgi:hypothetical protein
MASEPTLTYTPKLQIEPSFLDFGSFNPEGDLTQLPCLLLHINNIGEGKLIGRIIPQVSWLIISPVEFRCPPGSINIHKVQISTGFPKPLQMEHYSYKDLVFITSNGGEMFIDGEYHILPGKMKTKPEVSWGTLFIPLGLIFLLIFLAVTSLFLFRSGNSHDQVLENSISSLYTQGAQTVVMKMTLTAFQNTNFTTPSMMPVEPFYWPGSSPSPGQSVLIVPSFTPWPRESFQNPEQFIKDYYSAINTRNFDRSWAMLSPHFKDSCCNIGGNDPFSIYKNFWGYINKVEVLSAYLQEWDKNPARLMVSLRYIYKDGKIIESVNIYWLISDSKKNSLLINEVQ